AIRPKAAGKSNQASTKLLTSRRPWPALYPPNVQTAPRRTRLFNERSSLTPPPPGETVETIGVCIPKSIQLHIAPTAYFLWILSEFVRPEGHRLPRRKHSIGTTLSGGTQIIRHGAGASRPMSKTP